MRNFDTRVKLIQRQTTTDNIGNPEGIDLSSNVVFAFEQSIGLNDFLAADQTNYKFEAKYIVYSSEYNDENYIAEVDDNGDEIPNKRYKILRTYKPSLDFIELWAGSTINPLTEN